MISWEEEKRMEVYIPTTGKINYFYCTIIYDDPMLRKWTKIFRRTKQDITKGRRTY